MKNLVGFLLTVDSDNTLQLHYPNGIPCPDEIWEVEALRSEVKITFMFKDQQEQEHEICAFVKNSTISKLAGRHASIKIGESRNTEGPWPEDAVTTTALAKPGVAGFVETKLPIETKFLREYQFNPEDFVPLKTGTFLDMFVSKYNGFMRSTAIMLGGEKGVGKTSMLISTALHMQATTPGAKVLYVSGEMNPMIMKLSVASYYPQMEYEIETLWLTQYIRTGQVAEALTEIAQRGYDAIIWDSMFEILGPVKDELGISLKQAEGWFLDLLDKHKFGKNDRQIKTCHLIIQQMTKGGYIAGSSRMQHMVDTVLLLKKRNDDKRKTYIISTKNRLGGPTDLALGYKFTPAGIAYDTKTYEAQLQIEQLLSQEEELNEDKKDLTTWLEEVEEAQLLLEEEKAANDF